MCLFSLAEVERDLDREIQSPPAEARFPELVTRLPPIISRESNSWSDVRALLAAKGAKSEAVDPVLRLLVEKFQDSPDEPWVGIVLYVLWDSLAAMHGCLRRLDQPEALFSQITWALIQSIHRVDLANRRRRVGQKILNDTSHDVRAWYRRERERFPSLPTPDDGPNPYEEVPSHYREYLAAEQAIDLEWAKARLQDLTRKGAISRTDYQVLLSCHIYGRPLDEMASHLGIPYETAKRRRLRAIEKLQKSAPHMSPGDPASPLCPLGRSIG